MPGTKEQEAVRAEERVEKGELDVVLPNFVETLKTVREGEALRDADEALGALVAAVQRTGKKGSVTVTLKIGPAGGSAEQVFVADKIDTNLPKPERNPTLFFPTSKNALVRFDPKQGVLGL